QGGWPLTAFLNPNGEVFYGGTYFPPDGNHGRPGFASTLAELARIYREQPDRVAMQAGEIRKFVSERLEESQAGPLRTEILDEAADGISPQFDLRYGRCGTQPKFRHTPPRALLL